MAANTPIESGRQRDVFPQSPVIVGLHRDRFTIRSLRCALRRALQQDEDIYKMMLLVPFLQKLLNGEHLRLREALMTVEAALERLLLLL
jgi:hypothetical protein